MLAPIVIFGIAALGGVFLAVQRLRERPLPMPVALLHGALAALALVLLIVGVLRSPVPTAVWGALALFVVVALGGFLAFTYHLRGRPLPLPLLFIHGGAAVVAYLLLLYGALV